MNLLAAYYHDQPKEPITSRFGFVSRGITGAGRIEMGTFVAVVLLFSLSLSLSATTTNRNKPLIFQARITDLSRVRLADGTYNMKFKIWDAASGGSCLWATGSNESSGSANCASAGNVSVSVVRGVMVVQLGDDNASVTNMPPMNLDFDSSSYYLGMTVEADAEMTPRTRIGAGAYAYNADELDALNSGSFLRSDADDQTTSLITLTYTPAGTGVGQGPVYINPSSASTNYKLLNILINGSSKLSVDAEGDLTTAGNLTVSGTSDNSMTGNMIWSADNTYDIGASGANRPRRGYFATEVVVGGTVTISTNSIVGSGATTLSSTSGNLTLSTVTSGDIVLTPTGSGKVGVGTASPAAKLQVTAGSGIDVLKAGTLTVGSQQTIFLTSGSSWSVPSDWNSSNNTIEVIGGGAGGASAPENGGGGGGAGAYSKITNLSLTPSTSVAYAVGTGGAGGTNSNGTAGGDTYFCNSTSNCASIGGSAVQVGAKGGNAGSTTTGGTGGSSGSGVGTIKYSGGTGGNGSGSTNSGGGGGGSGGPNGNGANGGSNNGSNNAGGGGGGSGGGSAGASNSGDTGGAGGNNFGGTGSGAGGPSGNPGSAGTNGGGGGGGGFGNNNGGAGGAGTEWDATHGSGGGGGGGAHDSSTTTAGVLGGAGGGYGGAGGGAASRAIGSGNYGTGGNGSQGIVVITYTPANTSTDALFVSSAGYTGVGTASPATRLDVAGLTVNTDADGTVGAMRNTATFTKNDSNTRTFSVAKIVPTFNFGGSNTNTTVNVLDIDSTNTAVTGLTTNLLKASYGGTQKFAVDSSGNVTISGGISSIGGSILPSTDDTYDLGSSTFRWRDLFLGPSSLRLSTTTGETGTARAWKVGVDETDGATDGNLRIMEGSSQYLTVGTGGNVGIGTGATNPASLLHVAGIAQLGTASTTTGQLKLFNSGSANATIWQAGSVSTSYTLTWPTGYGSDTNILTTNGSGTLSWSAGGGGSNGWADDGTTVRLSTATDSVAIGTTTPVGKLTIEGGGISIGGFAQVGRQNNRVPLGNTISTVASTDTVGLYTSLTIGADGLPIIAYYDSTSGDLKAAKCNDVACTGGNETVSTVDATNNTGQAASVAIGGDGFPVVSYYDQTDQDIQFAKCNDVACSGGDETITNIADTPGNVGYTSTTIGTNGYPVVAYYDSTNQDLRAVFCGNAACSSGNTDNAIDTTGDLGANPSLAIGTDGFPVIAYYINLSSDLKVVKCGNATCSSGNTFTTVDTTGFSGQPSSLTVAPDGLPIIAYYDGLSSDLRVTKCGNVACSSGNTTTNVDSSNTTGETPAIAIGADGLPVIAYYYGWNGDLRILKCGNTACSSGNVIYDPDGSDSVGLHPSIAIGSDGLPIVSYYDSTNTALKVLHCANQYCLPNWTRR